MRTIERGKRANHPAVARIAVEARRVRPRRLPVRHRVCTARHRLAIAALVLALFLTEVPLRATIGTPDLDEAFAPVVTTRECPELVGVLRETARDTLGDEEDAVLATEGPRSRYD